MSTPSGGIVMLLHHYLVPLTSPVQQWKRSLWNSTLYGGAIKFTESLAQVEHCSVDHLISDYCDIKMTTQKPCQYKAFNTKYGNITQNMAVIAKSSLVITIQSV
jgi:hypothetical protein